MAFRYAIYHKGDIEGVAGSPYSAVPIYEALDALLEGFSAGIEAAERLFIAVINLQPGHGIAFLYLDGERSAAAFHLTEPACGALAFADLLELETVGCDFSPCDRFRRVQIAYGCPEEGSVADLGPGIFGNHTEAGSHNVPLRE